MIRLNKLFRLALLLPLFFWVYQIFFGNLGAEPTKELNHQTGFISLIYLSLNLWIGILWSFWKKWPASWRSLLGERRFLGVLTYFILIGHVFFYLALEAFEFKALQQIVEKTYLIFGGFAFLGMTILAFTSNNFSVKKLGGKRWKLLHRMIYFVTVLVSVHVFLIEKADLPLFAMILVPLWLAESLRLIRWLRRPPGLVNYFFN